MPNNLAEKPDAASEEADPIGEFRSRFLSLIESFADDEFLVFCEMSVRAAETLRERIREREEEGDGLCDFCGEAEHDDPRECPDFRAEVAAARERDQQVRLNEARLAERDAVTAAIFAMVASVNNAKDPNDVFTPDTGALEFNCSPSTMRRRMRAIRNRGLETKGRLLHATRAELLQEELQEKRGKTWQENRSSRHASTGAKAAIRSTVGSTGPTEKRRSRNPPNASIPLPLPMSSPSMSATHAIPLPLPDDPQR
jgi:hypothetical protein